MERVPERAERLDGQRVVRLARRAEDGPAELHAALDDSRAVGADGPLQRLRCELLCCRGRGVEEGELVEAQADLGVRAGGQAVQRAQVCDVRGGEGGVERSALRVATRCDWSCLYLEPMPVSFLSTFLARSFRFSMCLEPTRELQLDCAVITKL